MSAPLIIDLARREGLPDVEARLARLDAGAERRATSFVFRTGKRVSARALGVHELGPARAALLRSGGKAVYVLGYDSTTRTPAGATAVGVAGQVADATGVERIRLVQLEAGSLVDVADEEALLSNIRQSELVRLLSTDGYACQLQAADAAHYVAPSGRHCAKFLRVADIIRNREALDIMAFWLRPYLCDADVVLAA